MTDGARRATSMRSNTQQSTSLLDLPVANREFFFTGGRAVERGPELFIGSVLVESRFRNGPVRKHRNNIIGNLHEATVHVVANRRAAGTNTKLAVAQAAD